MYTLRHQHHHNKSTTALLIHHDGFRISFKTTNIAYLHLDSDRDLLWPLTRTQVQGIVRLPPAVTNDYDQRLNRKRHSSSDEWDQESLGRLHMQWSAASLCNTKVGRLHELGNGHTMESHQLWTQEQEDFTTDELVALACAISAADTVERTPERAIPERGQTAGRIINFKKTGMYANSRLPPYMPPFVVYLPTWRLLCLAAQASLNVYNRPKGEQKQHFINASWQNSTKAMVLQSRFIDDKNVIVFAIRGSQLNFVDWSVNFRPEPSSPAGFLDDAGNACHTGFLSVAKAMIRPVAARLRQLLEQNSSRAVSSLLITGHSAGGAVAALLYMHMLSTTVESELRHLTGCFRRIHCITFGAPPVSLLPLRQPLNHNKDLFLSVINEGDPIARAEKAYVVSLARVLAAPEPKVPKASKTSILKKTKSSHRNSAPFVSPYWLLPESTLCNAGSIVVIRKKPGSTDKLEAVNVHDERLRGLLFGDPSMHSMVLYKERIDLLATSVITGALTT